MNNSKAFKTLVVIISLAVTVSASAKGNFLLSSATVFEKDGRKILVINENSADGKTFKSTSFSVRFMGTISKGSEIKTIDSISELPRGITNGTLPSLSLTYANDRARENLKVSGLVGRFTTVGCSQNAVNESGIAMSVQLARYAVAESSKELDLSATCSTNNIVVSLIPTGDHAEVSYSVSKNGGSSFEIEESLIDLNTVLNSKLNE